MGIEEELPHTLGGTSRLLGGLRRIWQRSTLCGGLRGKVLRGTEGVELFGC